MPKGAKHTGVKHRLSRIEGQVRGLVRMVDEQRYCIDIIQQVTAVRRALDSVALQIMSGHINHCVSKAIRHREGPQKIDELIRTISRFAR